VFLPPGVWVEPTVASAAGTGLFISPLVLSAFTSVFSTEALAGDFLLAGFFAGWLDGFHGDLTVFSTRSTSSKKSLSS
jgi:hypothetical protein